MASQKALPSLWGGLRLNTVWIAVGFFLLGQACFSGWSLIVSFSGCSSILPLFCLFDSLSRCFCHLSRAGRPVLNDFRSLDQDYLFNNLVAQFVGTSNVVWCRPSSRYNVSARLLSCTRRRSCRFPAWWLRALALCAHCLSLASRFSRLFRRLLTS